ISGPVKSEDHKFAEMKPRVERLVNAQKNFVTKIVAEAEQLLTSGKEEEAGVQLLRANRGLPKHNRLGKLLPEQGNKRLMQKTEMEYLRDQAARLHEIDDELYYAIDEKDHSINLTEKGRDLLAGSSNDKDFFIIPDVGSEIALIENDPSLAQSQKQ